MGRIVGMGMSEMGTKFVLVRLREETILKKQA